MRSLPCTTVENRPFRFPVELLAHRFRASLNEPLELMGRAIGTLPVSARGMLRTLVAHGVLELAQAEAGFRCQRAANDPRHSIDAPMQPAGNQEPPEPVFELGTVK